MRQPITTNLKVHVIDTTLRDGEQAPGVAFSINEKMAIVRMRNSAGVDEFGVGTPAMGPSVCREVRGLVPLAPGCMLRSWCRALATDIGKLLFQMVGV